MARFLEQGTTVTISIGPFVDKTDGCSAETGLSTAYTSIFLSKNGGDLTAKHETTALAHAGAGAAATSLGYYHCLLDATDTDTLGKIRVCVSDDATHLPVWQDYQVVTHDFYQSMSGDHVIGAAAVSDIHTDVGTVLTNLATVDGIVDSILTDTGTTLDARLTDVHDTVDLVYTDLLGMATTDDLADAVLDEVVSGHAGAGSLGAGITDIHTDVGTVDTVVDGLATVLGDVHTDVGTAITQTTAANIAAAVWNALVASYTTAVSFGKYLGGAPAGATVVADIAAVKTSVGTPMQAGSAVVASNMVAAAPTAADVNAACDTAIADAALATAASLTLALKLLRNKTVTDPATGVMTVYDDNGTDVLFTANIYETAGTATPYAGNAINRKDRLA